MMKNVSWIKVKMNVMGISNTVERVLVIPDFLSLYYLHIIVATLFQFDDLLDVKIANEMYEIFISENNIELNEQMFEGIGQFLNEQGEQVFNYTYYGQDTWDLQINLQKETKKYNHITCIKATGNAILFERMTKNMYEQIYQYTQNPHTKAAIDFMKQYPKFKDIDLINADLPAIQEQLFLLEKNLLDDEILENLPIADMSEETIEESMQLLDDEFDTRNYLMYLYHELAGLSVDQAAYEILYRTNLGEIVEAMVNLDYEDEVIDKTLRMELPFDEKLYEQVSDAIDLLNVLPKRDELFNDEDETYLNQIDNIILAILEEHEVDLADLGDVSTDVIENVERAFVEQITKVKKQRLS